MKTNSQKACILRYLGTGGTLTRIKAINQFGIGNLPARVQELKNNGHPIQKTMVRSNGARFAVYFL